MTSYPLRRFADIHTDEADLYGPGAFSWTTTILPDGKHVKTICFLYPPHDEHDFGFHYCHVEDPGNGQNWWKMDGDDNRPNLSPSILIWTSRPGREKVEFFHGYIRNGNLEAL